MLIFYLFNDLIKALFVFMFCSYINLFVYFTSHPQLLLPSLLYSSVPISQSAFPSFLFRKGQVSHEYQQTITNGTLVIVRLSTSPCLKAGQDDPVWRIRSQTSLKESEIATVSLLEIQKEDKATTLSHIQNSWVSPIQASWLLVQSLWDPMSPG